MPIELSYAILMYILYTHIHTHRYICLYRCEEKQKIITIKICVPKIEEPNTKIKHLMNLMSMLYKLRCYTSKHISLFLSDKLLGYLTEHICLGYLVMRWQQ